LFWFVEESDGGGRDDFFGLSGGRLLFRFLLFLAGGLESAEFGGVFEGQGQTPFAGRKRVSMYCAARRMEPMEKRVAPTWTGRQCCPESLRIAALRGVCGKQKSEIGQVTARTFLSGNEVIAFVPNEGAGDGVEQGERGDSKDQQPEGNSAARRAVRVLCVHRCCIQCLLHSEIPFL